MSIFRVFEALLEPTALPPDAPPPGGLGAFYWHYARQARRLVVALFVAGSIVALLDTTIQVFIGRVVALLESHGYKVVFQSHGYLVLHRVGPAAPASGSKGPAG